MPDVQRPEHPPPASPTLRGTPPPSPGLAPDVVETSELLLQLIHAAHGAGGGPDVGHGPSAERSLSPHAIRAAIHIHLRGERTIGDLARGLGVSYGWASRIASELESSGLVERRTDAGDRRVVHVALAPSAVEVIEQAYRWRGGAIERALEPLDERGREAVRVFLRRATRELAGPAAGAGPSFAEGGAEERDPTGDPAEAHRS
jgi:DNA-binding MarR family transcriptional regulator